MGFHQGWGQCAALVAKSNRPLSPMIAVVLILAGLVVVTAFDSGESRDL